MLTLQHIGVVLIKAADTSPLILKCVGSDDNVLRILSLSEEYQMQKQKFDCENCLLLQVNRETRQKEGVTYLTIAQKYNLIRLRDRSADLASKWQLNDLEQIPEFNDLDPTYQLAVLKVWENVA